MTYVITHPCIGHMDGSCILVCPVPNCIIEGKHQMYIDPAKCIDCGACEPECPVGAIYPEHEVPKKWQSFIARNRDFFTA